MQDLYHQLINRTAADSSQQKSHVWLWCSGLQEIVAQGYRHYASRPSMSIGLYIRIFFRPAEHSKSFTWMNVRKLFGVEMQAETSQSPLQREC